MTDRTISLDHLAPRHLLVTAVYAAMSVEHYHLLMDVHLANQLPISESIVRKYQAAISCRFEACCMLINIGLYDQFWDAREQMTELYESSEISEPSDNELASVAIELVAA